jgi:hypothetical protein
VLRVAAPGKSRMQGPAVVAGVQKRSDPRTADLGPAQDMLHHQDWYDLVGTRRGRQGRYCTQVGRTQGHSKHMVEVRPQAQVQLRVDTLVVRDYGSRDEGIVGRDSLVVHRL